MSENIVCFSHQQSENIQFTVSEENERIFTFQKLESNSLILLLEK